MNSREKYQRIALQVADWAARLAQDEAAGDDIVWEMRQWVGSCPDRLWSLAASAVGCLKETMQGTVIGQTGNLLVPQKGSWIIKSMQGRHSREPDVVATMQIAIAMLNRDASMACDLLIAHERVAGAQGLFGIVLVATDTLAAMFGAGTWEVGYGDVGHMGDIDDWRI